MADSITAGGLYFPPWLDNRRGLGLPPSMIAVGLGAATVAGSGLAFIGRVVIGDGSGSKILSAAGGGSIGWLAGVNSITATTAIHSFGIMDVDTALGPPARPDGTYDVSATLTGSAAALFTGSGWNTTVMTSGIKTLSHGQLYAFVTRVVTNTSAGGLKLRGPGTAGNTFPNALPFAVTLSVTTAQASLVNTVNPNVLFNCDDGTLAWLEGAPAASAINPVSVSSGGANNEYGMRFVLPWTSTVDQLGVTVGGISSADCTVILYSDPNGTPVTITAIPLIGDQYGTTTPEWQSIPLLNPVTITASTTYLLGVRADVVSPTTFHYMEFAAAANKITLPGGGSLAQGARAGGVGAFSLVETRVPIGFDVRIHQISSGTTTVTVTTTTTITVGGAASILIHSGMVGGCRG